MPHRAQTALAAGLLLAALISCGREAPVFAPTTGSLSVVSTPSGAVIYLDGACTDSLTPCSFPGLARGEHEVSVALAGYAPYPVVRLVTVIAGSTVEASFTLTGNVGRIAVSSTPAGAAISVDGFASGTVTPDTLADVGVGPHVVRVSLAGYASAPESLEVNVASGQTAAADFVLTPYSGTAEKVVLLESFSNVSCPGCPAMSAAIHGFMATSGHGLDRVLLIKYSMNWPLATDPNYLANSADNTARMNYYLDYLAGGIPAVAADGGLLGRSGNPPPPEDLPVLIDPLLEADPGFSIAVDAQISGASSVPVTVTLQAVREVDLDGFVLNVVLVENPVLFDIPPGSEGETDFHWVMRDFESAAASLPNLEPGVPVVRIASLNRSPSWIAANLSVIAFVQNNTTREVLQAGSTLTHFGSTNPTPGNHVRPLAPTHSPGGSHP